MKNREKEQEMSRERRSRESRQGTRKVEKSSTWKEVTRIVLNITKALRIRRMSNIIKMAQEQITLASKESSNSHVKGYCLLLESVL
jgi:hypothetical protein